MLELLANIAQILTAVIALVAYGVYQGAFLIRRKKLEDYLEQKAIQCTQKPRFKNDNGKYSSLHLAAVLRVPEQDVIRLGYSSAKLKAVPMKDRGTRRAVAIYFRYAAPLKTHREPPVEPGAAEV